MAEVYYQEHSGGPFVSLLRAQLPPAIAVDVWGVHRDRCKYIISLRGGGTLEIPETQGLTSAETIARVCLELL